MLGPALFAEQPGVVGAESKDDRVAECPGVGPHPEESEAGRCARLVAGLGFGYEHQPSPTVGLDQPALPADVERPSADAVDRRRAPDLGKPCLVHPLCSGDQGIADHSHLAPVRTAVADRRQRPRRRRRRSPAIDVLQQHASLVIGLARGVQPDESLKRIDRIDRGRAVHTVDSDVRARDGVQIRCNTSTSMPVSPSIECCQPIRVDRGRCRCRRGGHRTARRRRSAGRRCRRRLDSRRRRIGRCGGRRRFHVDPHNGCVSSLGQRFVSGDPDRQYHRCHERRDHSGADQQRAALDHTCVRCRLHATTICARRPDATQCSSIVRWEGGWPTASSRPSLGGRDDGAAISVPRVDRPGTVTLTSPRPHLSPSGDDPARSRTLVVLKGLP